ncbi:mechanosensitive ion channel family protein [Aquimarina sp. M1]
MPEFDIEMLKKISIGVGVLFLSFFVIFFILKVIGKNKRTLLPIEFVKRVKIPLFLLLLITVLQLKFIKDIFTVEQFRVIKGIITVLYIVAFTWAIIVLIRVLKNQVVKSYDINAKDNLKARKVLTQFNILERIVIFIIIIFAIGIGLMSFESIRSVGVSMLTSAGVAGIIIGFSAQKALGTLLAGIQIAFTQPIRLDDVVIVEGEWGTIEQITLTYVVIKIWDKRRLIVPTTYFIEKPFQNWTRSTSELLGTVFIHTDYMIDVDLLREELTKILQATDLWDGNVNIIQVTDAKRDSVELRALVSAVDSPTAWDLRVYVREKLISFLKENYPDSIPKTRVLLDNNKGN